MDILLALGGGGSKGNAHIGVIRILEREGFNIKAIAGASAGGMAAVAYAAGFSPDFLQEYMESIDQNRLFGFHLGEGPSLLGIKGVASAMKELLGEITFDQLKIPCALTAVDLETGKEMVLNTGSVFKAVLATIAIPGIFPPCNWDECLLVDGAVINPVPVSTVRQISPNKNLPVVAVSLTSSVSEKGLLPNIKPKAAEVVFNQISRLKVAQAFDIFLRSIEIGMTTISEFRLQLDQPEVIVRPDVKHIGYLEKVNIAEVVKLGEEAMIDALPELKKFYSWRSRFSKWFK